MFGGARRDRARKNTVKSNAQTTVDTCFRKRFRSLFRFCDFDNRLGRERLAVWMRHPFCVGAYQSRRRGPRRCRLGPLRPTADGVRDGSRIGFATQDTQDPLAEIGNPKCGRTTVHPLPATLCDPPHIVMFVEIERFKRSFRSRFCR